MPKKWEVAQNRHPLTQPTPGTSRAPLPEKGMPKTRLWSEDGIEGCTTGRSGSSPRCCRSQRMPSPLTTWSHGMSFSTPSMAVPWPPRMISAPGWSFRTRRAISWALRKLGTMKLMPTMSKGSRLRVRMKSRRLGKSSTWTGLSTLAARKYSPNDRWCTRSDAIPWALVIWLWNSSMMFSFRPHASSTPKGPKTEARRMRLVMDTPRPEWILRSGRAAKEL